MAEDKSRPSKVRALTLTVDIERVAFLHTIDTHMEVSEQMTQGEGFHVMLHAVGAIGEWCNEVNRQLELNTQEGPTP